VTEPRPRCAHALAAINEGFDATHIPSYGPSRAAEPLADVRLAESGSAPPAAPQPHVLVAFNAPSLTKFAPDCGQRAESSSTTARSSRVPKVEPSIRVIAVRCSEIAKELGRIVVKNIVALEPWPAVTNSFPRRPISPPSVRFWLRRPAHPAQREGLPARGPKPSGATDLVSRF